MRSNECKAVTAGKNGEDPVEQPYFEGTANKWDGMAFH